MKKSVILMTALVPTIGHKYLIDFALEYHRIKGDTNEIHVVISTRKKEPTSFQDRVTALYDTLNEYDNVHFHEHTDENAPQNPNASVKYDSEFWKYWKDIVEQKVGKNIKKIFASEPYGKQMAEVLKCEFIPVDIPRNMFNIKGTNIRKNLTISEMSNFILPNNFLGAEIVMFGQESVGKTTTAKNIQQFIDPLADDLYVSEYARPYLETVGSNLSVGKMNNIQIGQHIQEITQKKKNKTISVFDTDILSTYGYYKLMCDVYGKKDYQKGFINVCHKVMGIDRTKRIYYVLKDNIPFEKDILRYGGDKRETDMQYWIDILQKFKMNYHIIESQSLNDRTQEIMTHFYEKTDIGQKIKNIMEFERE